MKIPVYWLFTLLLLFAGCSADELNEPANSSILTKATERYCWFDTSGILNVRYEGAGDAYSAVISIPASGTGTVSLPVRYDNCSGATLAYSDYLNSSTSSNGFSYTFDGTNLRYSCSSISSGTSRWFKLQLIPPSGASVAPASPRFIRFVQGN